MKKHGDISSRSEITEQVERKTREMEEKETDLDKIASDVETVRETLDNLDLGGTHECAEELMSAFNETEGVTVEEFDSEDESLEQIQDESQEHEEKVEGHRDSSESDLGKVSDASSRIELKVAQNELVKAKEAALRDIEFLAEQIDQAREAREKSDEIQSQLRARVQSNG